MTTAMDGSGGPLVRVHGSAGDYRTWQAQREAFAHRYRVVTYSRPYHWPNATTLDGADYPCRSSSTTCGGSSAG
jgi:non-heme chloroperoxidase